MRSYEVTAFMPHAIQVFTVFACSYEQAEAIADEQFPSAVDFEITEVV